MQAILAFSLNGLLTLRLVKLGMTKHVLNVTWHEQNPKEVPSELSSNI